MVAPNTDPIYSKFGDLQGGGAIIGTSANTATDGTGANSFLIYTSPGASGEGGGFVRYVEFRPVSTIAATVIRLWWCSATGAFTPGTTNTAANSYNIGELTVAAWTASNTLASIPYIIPVYDVIPPLTKLFVTFGTSTGAGTTGFNPIVRGGKYQ